MFDGYFAFGGNEVGNSGRVAAFADIVGCRTPWDLFNGDCPGIRDAEALDYSQVAAAPWFDPDDPEVTGNFLGMWVVGIRGLSDSTRDAKLTQKAGDGAKASGYRHASREVRVRAWLAGVGEEALEAGTTWLRNVLEPDACGIHGGACREADFSFFVACPPERRVGDDEESIEDYQERIAPLRRYLHSVRCISGPTVTQEYSSDGVHGRMVEMVFAAEVPFVYGAPKLIDIPSIVPSVIQDVPYNLVPYPSAEAAGSSVVTATNHSLNPSVEDPSNITAWAVAADAAAILVANVVGSRSTELFSVGTASYRARWTAPGAGASAGWFAAQQDVLIPSTARMRFSVNLWGAASIEAGSPVLGSRVVEAIWMLGSTVLRTDAVGTIAGSAGAVTLTNILPPATADRVRVRVKQNVTSWNAGSIVRLYADALAVTTP